MNGVPAATGVGHGSVNAAPPVDPEALARDSAGLEAATAREVLAWTFERFKGQRIGLSSAFGAEGCALLHLARELEPQVPVYTIDTGYLFAESVAVREAYRAMGADIRVIEPLISIRSQAARHGPDLFARDPDACCDLRKVAPMRRILTLVDVWITAVRRDQSDTRAQVPIVGTATRADGSLVVKVAPLARWTRGDTWSYILEHALPYNALLDAGYTSIGCEPCTRPADAEAQERGGRWVGQAKTECGIHQL